MATLPKVMFSHVGVYVHDLAQMETFYRTALGLVVTDRGTLPGSELVFMSRDAGEHHQLVLASGRHGAHDVKVLNQISFRLETLSDLRKFRDLLSANQDISNLVPINHGLAWSIYFRDPEGNRIEIFVDSPWYVEQPIADPLDLNLTDDEIAQQTERTYQDYPGFQPRTEWQENLTKRLDS